MCLTGTTPGGPGRPGSRPYSLSEHPGGRDGGVEGGEKRRSGGQQGNVFSETVVLGMIEQREEKRKLVKKQTTEKALRVPKD